MISGLPEERALLAAEAAAQAGRLTDAAGALAGAAAPEAALAWASARWDECRGALGAARRSALDAASQAGGAPALASLAWLSASGLHLDLGEPRRAQDCLVRAAEVVPDDWALGQTLLAVGQARVDIFLGQLAEARAALDAAGEGGAALSAVALRRAQGLLHACSGAPQEAVAHFAAAAAGARRAGLPYFYAAGLLGAAGAALEAGQAQPAQGWLAEVQVEIEAGGFQRLRGHRHRLRGQLAAAGQDYRAAVSAFVEALRTFVALEDRLGVACTDLAFGAMLVREPGAGEPRRGLFLLAEARDIFERAGAELAAQAAVRLLAGV